MYNVRSEDAVSGFQNGYEREECNYHRLLKALWRDIERIEFVEHMSGWSFDEAYVTSALLIEELTWGLKNGDLN